MLSIADMEYPPSRAALTSVTNKNSTDIGNQFIPHNTVGRDGSFMDLGVYAHRIDYKYDSLGYRLRENDW